MSRAFPPARHSFLDVPLLAVRSAGQPDMAARWRHDRVAPQWRPWWVEIFRAFRGAITRGYYPDERAGEQRESRRPTLLRKIQSFRILIALSHQCKQAPGARILQSGSPLILRRTAARREVGRAARKSRLAARSGATADRQSSTTMAAVVDGDLPRIRRGGATSEEIERKRNSDEEVRPTPQMPTHL